MCIVQCLRNLFRDLDYLGCGNASFGELLPPLCDRQARCKNHHHQQVADGYAQILLDGLVAVEGGLQPLQVEHCGDVGMVQAGDEGEIVADSPKFICTAADKRRQALDRHVDFRLCVACEIDGPESSAAKATHDLVLVEKGERWLGGRSQPHSRGFIEVILKRIRLFACRIRIPACHRHDRSPYFRFNNSSFLSYSSCVMKPSLLSSSRRSSLMPSCAGGGTGWGASWGWGVGDCTGTGTGSGSGWGAGDCTGTGAGAGTGWGAGWGAGTGSGTGWGARGAGTRRGVVRGGMCPRGRYRSGLGPLSTTVQPASKRTSPVQIRVLLCIEFYRSSCYPRSREYRQNRERQEGC